MARGGIALASVPGPPTGKAGRTGSRCRRRRGSRARQPGRLPQSSRADAVRRRSQRGGSAPLGGGGQVGNEIDAARRENGAFGAGQLVRASQGNVGRGGGGGGGGAELLRQRLQRRRRVRARAARASSVAGAHAPGLRRAVKPPARKAGSSARSIAVASLSSSTATIATSGR